MLQRGAVSSDESSGPQTAARRNSNGNFTIVNESITADSNNLENAADV